MAAKKRIIYLDIMRALAVILMLQGHTMGAFLNETITDPDSGIYSFWKSLRGITAPIFMFTAGTVFTYLLNVDSGKFFKNERITKGLKRFIVLLLIGYFLRYPTHKLFFFSDVTIEQWLIFFSVDALHLIAFGIFFIILLKYASLKFMVPEIILYLLSASIVFLLSPFVLDVNWNNYLYIPFAAYLFYDTGSIFPFFPWLAYLFAGAVLGTILKKYPGVYKKNIYSGILLASGVLLVLISLWIQNLGNLLYIDGETANLYLGIPIYRLGIVLILNSTVSFIFKNVNSVPRVINSLGRHSLAIYVVHLVIIYGSAWSPGLTLILGKSLNIKWAVFAAVLMIILMSILSIFAGRIRIFFYNFISNLRIDKFKII